MALTHCILNRLAQTICILNPIPILGTSGYEIYIFLEKKWLNYLQTGDPDQTPRSAASDLGLHCLPITLLRVSRLQWVKVDKTAVCSVPYGRILDEKSLIVRNTPSDMCAQLRQINLSIPATLMSASRNFASLATQNALNEDSDQTARLHRLI